MPHGRAVELDSRDAHFAVKHLETHGRDLGSPFLVCLVGRAGIHKRLIYKGDRSTHAHGTDPRVALGAYVGNTNMGIPGGGPNGI